MEAVLSKELLFWLLQTYVMKITNTIGRFMRKPCSKDLSKEQTGQGRCKVTKIKIILQKYNEFSGINYKFIDASNVLDPRLSIVSIF